MSRIETSDFDLLNANGQNRSMSDGTLPSFQPDSISKDSWQGHAFELHAGRDFALPVLIAAPHGGRAYSSELMANFRHADTRRRLEDRHVDTLARAVASETGAAVLIAMAPRAMIDLNRAPDDIDWSMVRGDKPEQLRHSLANRRARSGLGLIPRRLPGLGEIWKQPIERSELDRRLSDVHRPYHQSLAATLERIRDKWGASLLLDLHSMPPLPRRYHDEVAPEFVLGDRFGSSCDGRLVATALNYFGEAERPVAHNRPYSGGYVLDLHGAPRRGLHAIQIEVCRSSYLDSRLMQPSARLQAVAKLIAGLVRRLAADVADIGQSDRPAQAAE